MVSDFKAGGFIVRSEAALLVIGDEILSGRTQEKNINFLAKSMTQKGIDLLEARVVSDKEDHIIRAVDSLRLSYDYVFTSGGIGPTHDDITALSIAKAFALPLIKHEDAFAKLDSYYSVRGIEFNKARQKMAYTPQGARLIDNPVSIAPGFIVENVYVLAGVPEIFQAMVEGVISQLAGGVALQSATIATNLTEGDIAQELAKLQLCYNTISIGSYPHICQSGLGLNIVLRGVDSILLANLVQEIETIIIAKDGAILPQKIC